MGESRPVGTEIEDLLDNTGTNGPIRRADRARFDLQLGLSNRIDLPGAWYQSSLINKLWYEPRGAAVAR